MKKRFLKLISFFVLLIFSLSSCISSINLPPPGTPLSEEQMKEARRNCMIKYGTLYGVPGALTGVVLGGLITRRTEGMLIGGGIGGLIGIVMAWGKCSAYYSSLKSYSVSGYEETAKRIKYDPSKGYIVRIENYYLNPNNVVSSGIFLNGTHIIQMNAQYYVMAPKEIKEVKVIETRTVYYWNELEKKWIELGSVDQEIIASPGTRRAEGSFELPVGIPTGVYQIALKISVKDKDIADEKIQELDVGEEQRIQAIKKEIKPIQIAKLEESKEEITKLEESKEEKKKTEIAMEEQVGAKVVSKKEEEKIYIKVIVKELNVRENPTTKSNIIGKIKNDEIYEVIESKDLKEGKWFKIKLEEGTEGWVSGKYVKLIRK